MVSGSSVGNTVTTGAVTIPLMKRTGYQPEFAGAVEAAASTGGQIMPPIMGAAAFLMAEMAGRALWLDYRPRDSSRGALFLRHLYHGASGGQAFRVEGNSSRRASQLLRPVQEKLVFAFPVGPFGMDDSGGTHHVPLGNGRYGGLHCCFDGS